ncbi:hypothetical protein RB195_006224 [Necator americanus]|uniref:Uncharacterized protein n=1 Tax=Necator americanus TaxID=51031 RepID=A0ABR1BVD4_NECAM
MHWGHFSIQLFNPRQRSQARVYLPTTHPIMLYASKTRAAPSAVMKKLDYMERKLFRRMLGYFRQMVCHNEELYSEADIMYRRMAARKPSIFCPAL